MSGRRSSSDSTTQIFEVPSNLVLKRFTPSRYIASITTLWGIIATLTGLTHNFAGLVACRLLLGVVEAGLFPGMTIYLTFFYTKRELALRIGYLFVSSALAGAFGGLLAYAIGHMDGVAGLRGWRWIMILEGLPTFVMGIVTWFALADDPEHAYYLNPKEKAMMVARRARQTGFTASAQQFHWKDARKAFTDWKVIAFCVAQFGTDTVLYGYSTFLPTIIEGLGKWKSAQVQALTIPCYCLGAITYIVVARLSDAQQQRGLYTAIFGVIAAIGYALLISNSKSGVHYFGCFLVALGLYVAVGLPLAWLPSNCPRYGKRTVATALQLTFGNCSGIMAPYVSLGAAYWGGPKELTGHRGAAVVPDQRRTAIRERPCSDISHACIRLGRLCLHVGRCHLGLRIFKLVLTNLQGHFARINAKRRAGEEDGKVENKTEEEIAELGDESPRFVYTM